MKRNDSQNCAYIFILPWIIGFLVFQLYPFIASFFYSFTDFSVLKSMKFVGLKNYIQMFTGDRLFYKSLWATIKYVLIDLCTYYCHDSKYEAQMDQFLQDNLLFAIYFGGICCSFNFVEVFI